MRNNIKLRIKNNLIIILVILLIFQLVIFIKPINISNSDSYRYEYNSDKMFYPGYKERIDAIKKAHPNWKFIIMETGLDWNDVIKNEYTGHFDTPKNLIQGKSGGWICSICGSRVYDTGEWMCASEQAIRYYMDPRNWLVDSPYLFQFLQTDYMETLSEDIYAALNGTFLYSREVANVINKVCKEKNASPYFIIARILQEQGTAGGRTYKMQDTDGKYYYNLFNIGATGNTADEVYKNALDKAKKEGWTSIESCLNGGISFLLSSYISYKQNTLYLNKFDVETYMGTYVKQYMQNIEAPKNEAISMYNKMKNANLLNKSLTFVIPVYENMPELTSMSPDSIGEISPKNIRVKEGHYGITVRAGRSTTSSQIGRINDSSEIILSVERYSDGWHKIILESGLIGYVKFNSDYLEEVADVTNCYEIKVINNNTILRAGPSLEFAEITTLKAGDEIIRIDNTGRYNFGGNIWDRVILKDGRQGFVIRDALRDIDTNARNEVKEENIIEQNIIEENENNIIEDSNIIENNNSMVENNVTDNNSQNQVEENMNEIENNENEDKSENTNETKSDENKNANETESNENTNNIENNQVEENNNNDVNIGQNNEQNQTNNEVIEDDTKGEEERKYLVIGPDKNADDLDGIVTKNGVETKEAGTGYRILIDGKEYIIVKRGDANGDGYVKANDYLIIKDYIIGKNQNLKDEYLQAADVTNDKAVKANDYLKIKDHIMYGVEI